MRRTYRDGTRTLCPCRTVWPLAGLFFVPEPLRQKKALLRVLLPVQHSQGTRPRPPCLKGENARFSELSCRPCPNSFPQGPTFPQFSRPSRPAACSCPLRCAQGHHSEATQGITAKQALVQGVRTVPMPHQTSSLPVAFAPAQTVSSKGERRGRITLGQQVLQTVRRPDSWFDNWFDNQASASTLRRTSAPVFSCSSAKRPEGMASSTASPICASVPVPSSFSWWSPCVLFVQVFRTVSGNCPETDRAWTRTALLFLLEPAR